MESEKNAEIVCKSVFFGLFPLSGSRRSVFGIKHLVETLNVVVCFHNTPFSFGRLNFVPWRKKETTLSQSVQATSLEPAPLGNSSPEGSAVISVAKIVKEC